ncbi:hypothetical protein LH51_17745 [Nitrincola sp. A-D6]|uniref:cation diffusion facilitator family transporter n=1 Tax=Nitrincola sp. A-D6 TaxID=1545442 RepID=UPI00051F94F1|nr:cation diffusion facilitator family transporter [Nitrincola sp. A-D6]KGK41037.1 hypothetical protein LH51_17745 [Nitrincola sp. A-D6]
MLFFKVGRERSTLIFSAGVSGFFAFTGILCGLWTGSLAILFDGAYSSVSLVLSLLSVMALRWSGLPASNHFNFGRILAEPLVIAIKGFIILLVCLISLLSALNALMTGGREIVADMATGFAFFSVMGCVFTWRYLQYCNLIHQSALVDAEAKQWCMDSLLSAAVLLGLLIAWGMTWTAYAHWAVYVDPLLVVLVSVYIMAVPVRMMLQGMGEIMMMSPKPELRKRVYRSLSEIGIQPSQSKMAKVGSYLLLEVSIGVEHVQQMEGLQQRIDQQFGDFPLEVKTQILFYPKWPRGAVSLLR